tara:strand:- start:1210 stop:2079 length:870 start_codon:yes stop_codon:yes gene_type:complete
MKGRSGIISSTRQLLMDIGTPGDYEFKVYGMYSLRYLNREYNGDVLLAYLDSSGATQGFTPTELVDGTLTTFAAGDTSNGRVRVKTLYDQSGEGNDASQTSRFNMPVLVEGGTINTLNGLPALDFDGGNDFIPLNSALPDIRTGHCSSFVVGEYDGTTLDPAELMLSLGATTASARWYSPMGYQNQYIFGYASTWNEQVIAGSDTDPHLFTAIAGSNQGNWSCFIDGSVQGTATRQVRSSGGTYGIGGLNSVSQYALDGRVSEVLVFDGDCSTTRAAIEKNIMDYYNIS